MRKSSQIVAVAAALMFSAGTAGTAFAQGTNPCAPKANPCAAKKANPCAAKKANPCAANPCAAKKANPCAANPCAPKKK